MAGGQGRAAPQLLLCHLAEAEQLPPSGSRRHPLIIQAALLDWGWATLPPLPCGPNSRAESVQGHPWGGAPGSGSSSLAPWVTRWTAGGKAETEQSMGSRRQPRKKLVHGVWGVEGSVGKDRGRRGGRELDDGRSRAPFPSCRSRAAVYAGGSISSSATGWVMTPAPNHSREQS